MTLAGRLLLLVALALTPPLIVGILNDATNRNERAARLQQDAVAESRSLQDSMGLVTRGAQRLLITLAEVPAIKAGDTVACTTFLKHVSGQLKDYALLGVTDRTGSIICDDAGNAPGSISVANRAYFKRTMATGAFSSGDLVVGLETHIRSLHFAVPYRNDNGEIAGIVLASLDQRRLAEQLVDPAAPLGAELLLLDPSGTVVAAVLDRIPVNADWVGAPAPQAFRDALNVSAPRVVEMRGPDGTLRLFGAVPRDPALAGNILVVGLDRERAFADLRDMSLRNLLGLGLGGLLALVAGAAGARRFVLAPLASLSAAADRIGAGDLQARTDLSRLSGEIRELGAVFDRMTTALAERERERDAAEAALRREEARLRLALEAGGLGSFEWNLKAGTVQPSETVRTMFGFSPAEGCAARDYLERIVPEDRDKVRADVKEGINSGRLVHSYRIIRDGERRHILAQAEVAPDSDGQPLLIGLLADETERFENIAALRESEARFQAIANSIDQMVWSTRADGYHDYFNQRWYEFTGTAPGSSDGQSWMGLFHPDDQAETERVWQASLATGRPYHREYRLRHVSGRYRWVLGRAQAIHDEQGRITRWYGTCTDIDEIIQAREVLAHSREALTREIADRTAELTAAEEQLRQSQKMEAVGQLTGGIAHDFNNMLQAIGGALELLVRRVEQNKLDDAKRFAGVARTTVDRAASLTHRLLAFARRQTLSPEAVDPAELVTGMAELVARTVGPAIDLVTHQGDDTWMVLCDLNQLENVVFNLCINARDAMPGGGKLTITTGNVVLTGSDVAGNEGATAGDYVEITVADTGVGMDEATRARAFEPFFTTKPTGQGTGLGLSQVYGFVRQSGGFVRLESDPGAGTTVRLLLPRHHAVPVAPPREAGSDGVILLVEDEADVRNRAADHLRELGFNVRTCATGTDAMHLLNGGLSRLDLLVTEIGLPGNLNGRQIAEAARQRRPGLPVLFITGYAASLKDGALAPGMAMIAKPFSPEALAVRVRELLSAVPAPA
ncbi:MAG: PAS domain-containing protein [Acetobacteraceae bacterium]|nr:PAS domain-containing protein [Acetobacteraceae bacterium]